MPLNKIHPIEPESPPRFPCWLWGALRPNSRPHWFHALEKNWLRPRDTHWHEDQPNEPKETPPNCAT